jgi:DNA-binding response OmpR family regulator
MKILIIEDDKITLNSLKYIIEQSGHSASTAKDGNEAIDLLLKESFDLIFCDVMMPGISGLSLLTYLRSVHLFTMPIVMMSSLNDESLFDMAFEAGADDFIIKPFTEKDISGKIIKYENKDKSPQS